MNTRTLTLLAATIAARMTLAQTAPPPTEKKPVTDELQGVKVVDDYRWLEDWSNAKVQAWSEAQNTYARSMLDKLPGVETIRLLRDYLEWERHPVLRRRAKGIVRRMEAALG